VSEPVRTVLMGDPTHFSVQGGANPHTRTRWGTRRKVNRQRAIAQWKRLKATLEDLGVRVMVVPPDPACPGLVYPANAGFQSRVDRIEPLASKTFTLSNLLPTRAAEKAHYGRVLAAAGFRTAEIDAHYRFEGEADFFPAGDGYLLTHGTVVRQRFVPSLSIPPWRRVYGFRTNVQVERVLAPMVAPTPILRVGLALEAHYHGDTALCAFGPGRKYLLAYRRAIERKDWKPLENRFGENLIELSEPDANRYAANSFTLCEGSGAEGDGGRQPILVMPDGVSTTLLGQIQERGVHPLTVDVSEFLKKGGGSVKCMIGDLGCVSESESS
jgi:N-dimethylarginine dimethylaminohydrolase